MTDLAEPPLPNAPSPIPPEAMTAESMRQEIISKLMYVVGKNPVVATKRDWFVATSLAVRDHIVDRWMAATEATYAKQRKRVYYLSLEFLIGQLLMDSLTQLGLTDVTRDALTELGVDLEELRRIEPDAALGNGGLGRLAACYLESMSSLSVAAHGFGIRYDHGLFRQGIKDGWQTESPEDWLSVGNPWEFERPEVDYRIGFGGQVEQVSTPDGELTHVWTPSETVEAVAYDTPVVGWRGRHVNTLRLWSARAVAPLRLEAFNSGDHIGALAERVKAEAISKVLYPSDASPAGQELRLRQEYFFASASLQDLVGRHMRVFGDIRSLPDKAAIQLNDTHPSIAVAELMRILIDEHRLEWDEAWDITTATFSYTNHTLLPEALETWPVALMERLLPRPMQIIYLINAAHLDRLRRGGHVDDQKLSSLSVIGEGYGRHVRMGHLAFLGSHKVNGVSALHTELMRKTVFHDLNALFPGRITNKTNGITFRRWLYEANPELTALLAETLGPKVLDDPEHLQGLEAHAADPAFQERFMAMRQVRKQALARLVRERTGVRIDPQALFDVQVKRIHEYKRQLLNILEAIALYDAIRAEPMRNWIPRVKIFAGKAAASYHQAKLIIKLANDVARAVNGDPTVRGLLKVVFVPNYNVSTAEVIIPAADLSEQISTAGMEASGTGNMKFGLNGALTIGTLDGANVEMKDRVGSENIFIFGLTAEEVAAKRAQGEDAGEAIAASPVLGEVLDAVDSGVFSPNEPGRFAPLVDAVRHHDYFMVARDFDAYYAMQRNVAARWADPASWWKSAILNTARMGWFSSDRAIREYADEIWGVPVRPLG